MVLSTFLIIKTILLLANNFIILILQTQEKDDGNS